SPEPGHFAHQATFLRYLARLHDIGGDGRKARAAAEEAVAVAEDALRSFPGDQAASEALAESYLELGRIHKEGGDVETGMRYEVKARAVFQTGLDRLVNEHPTVQHWRSHLALCCNNLGHTQREAGRDPEALQTLTYLRDLCEQLTAGFYQERVGD